MKIEFPWVDPYELRLCIPDGDFLRNFLLSKEHIKIFRHFNYLKFNQSFERYSTIIYENEGKQKVTSTTRELQSASETEKALFSQNKNWKQRTWNYFWLCFISFPCFQESMAVKNIKLPSNWTCKMLMIVLITTGKRV